MPNKLTKRARTGLLDLRAKNESQIDRAQYEKEIHLDGSGKEIVKYQLKRALLKWDVGNLFNRVDNSAGVIFLEGM